MTSDAELIELIPAWLASTQEARIAMGLSRDEAMERAYDLYSRLGSQSPNIWDQGNADDFKDVLHAATSVVLPAMRSGISVSRADALYRLISNLSWRDYEHGEKMDLLRTTAFAGWQSAGVESSTLLALRKNSGDAHLPPSEASQVTKAVGCVQIGAVEVNPGGLAAHLVQERIQDGSSLMFLFEACYQLAVLNEYRPLESYKAAVKTWRWLEAASGTGLFDERLFFMAELARLAGVACRLRGKWEEAAEWFERAEGGFSETLEPNAGLAKVAYAQLGLLYHRYRLQEALENAGTLANIFEQLGMPLHAAKSMVVEGVTLKGMGRFKDAISVLEAVAATDAAKAMPAVLVRVLAHIGDAYNELGLANEAGRVLSEAGKHLADSELSFAAADYRTVCAGFLRSQGRVSRAAQLFRRVKTEYLSLGSESFAAYAAVLLAETNLMLGLTSAAEDELRWALPILEAHEMLPESCAALAMLRESMRGRHLDPHALRELREALKRQS